MVTTIQISEALKRELQKRKIFSRETYEDVIWDLIEADKELSEETLRHLEASYRDIEEGRVYSLVEVKKELGL